MHLNYAGKQNYSDNITVYFLYDYEVRNKIQVIGGILYLDISVSGSWKNLTIETTEYNLTLLNWIGIKYVM